MREVSKMKGGMNLKKTRIALLTAIVTLTTLGSVFAMGLIKGSSSTPPRDPLFTYTAKWICYPAGGQVFIPTLAESIGLTPGEYKTDVNVHNPTFNPALNITKKFVLSVPEAPIVNATNVAFANTLLLPDGAFRIDCQEILSLLGLPPFDHPFKGFVILTTNVSNLDVWAEYSSEAFSTTLAGPGSVCFLTSTTCTPEGIALDVEQIKAVAVPVAVCSPSSTITASPSFLNVTRGFNATATIVITNSLCTTINECFTVSFIPSVSGGPTGLVIPPCVTVSPGGSATATLIIFTTTTTPPGGYTVIVTATDNSFVPPLVQTIKIGLRVV